MVNSLTAQIIFAVYLSIWYTVGVSAQPPETHLASTLAADLRALLGKLRRRLREQGGPQDLPPSQISVLLRLEKEGPATVSGLARAEAMRPQSMSSAIAQLEAAGLVSGAPDPQDRRQTLLSLTESCRLWLCEARAARQDWLTRTIQARLSGEEQATLERAVRLLERLADGGS